MNMLNVSLVILEKAESLGEIRDESTGDYTFRDEAALLKVLARILQGSDPVYALGSPGDWGYSNAIGMALIATQDDKT